MKLSNIKLKVLRPARLVACIIAVSFPTMIFFQNCANKTSFAGNSLSSSAVLIPNNVVRIDPEAVAEPALPPKGPQPSQPIVIDSKCDAFVEVISDQFTIPSKDASNICYYKKIFTGVASGNTSNYLEVSAVDNQQAKSLMMQESVSLIINLGSERRVVISSSYLKEEPFIVDNFLMIQADSDKAHFSGWSYFYENTNLKNNVNGDLTDISFYSINSGLDAWEITHVLKNNKNVNLVLSTLDNGGSYGLSPNMYIVFK